MIANVNAFSYPIDHFLRIDSCKEIDVVKNEILTIVSLKGALPGYEV